MKKELSNNVKTQKKIVDQKVNGHANGDIPNINLKEYLPWLVKRVKPFDYKEVVNILELRKQGLGTSEIAKSLGRSDYTVFKLTREFLRAAEKGYTLKEYIEEGRPFKQSYGKKIVK